MKGFIEVTGYDGTKRMVNVDLIKYARDNQLDFPVASADFYDFLQVKETYDEIKALIEEAQKEDNHS